MARRENEYKQSIMLNSIGETRNLHHKAHWEQKTIKTIENRMVRNRIADMKRRVATNLDQRKQRLSQLLAAEESQYEKEF